MATNQQSKPPPVEEPVRGSTRLLIFNLIILSIFFISAVVIAAATFIDLQILFRLAAVLFALLAIWVVMRFDIF